MIAAVPPPNGLRITGLHCSNAHRHDTKYRPYDANRTWERHRRIRALAIWLSFVVLVQMAHTVRAADCFESVATALRAKYESALPSLQLEERRHFAVRLYRMTGDTSYCSPIFADFKRAADDLKRDLAGRDNPGYVERRGTELMSEFNPKTRKGRQRRKLFQRKRDMFFALNILTNTKRIADHLRSDEKPDSLLEEGISYLRSVDFTRVLLDESVIRVYSPQAVNFIYYLHDLGISDLRPQYADAFRRVFPDDRDARLSRNEFRDKVYGLTHFILAASDYYQHAVDSAEYAWILDYFSSNLDRILAQGTADIIAEVGICFLLANEIHSPELLQCQNLICSRFDPEQKMILSPGGSDDVEKGEHRNVLALMLLSWPAKLCPGPSFSNSR